MTDRIILSRGRKIFSMQELRNCGLTQYKVHKMVIDGRLKKLNKCYYENTGYHGKESDFYYVEAYTPKGIVCLLSAAAYYHLTMFIPEAVDVAIPRKAKISAIPEQPRLNVHHYTDARHDLGVITVREGENEFRIYNMEKTVTDVVFYKEKIGIPKTKEILVTYLHRKDRDLDRLIKYAELMKCDKTMKQYLEVLL